MKNLDNLKPDDLLAGTILLINKPLGWTSFDIVSKVRIIIRRHLGIPKIKIGHAGTLDPLASGLLLLCTSKKTKEIETLQSMPKTYTGKFVIGATTPSFDRETEVNETFDYSHVNRSDIDATAIRFTGTQEQIPPLFSAVKINGKRAYTIARANETAELKPKQIHVYSFRILSVCLPEIEFEIVCSKGTYIRSLARDFGLALGSGAYLGSLCRTSIGEHHLVNAFSIDEIEEAFISNLL
jgi:tRNA pseudouridine55 synthase